MNHRPLVSSPHVGARRLPSASRQGTGWLPWVTMAGALVALTMLAAFYAIVSGGVERAQTSRDQARAELERQVVCSAFSSASSRDLCLSGVTVGATTSTLRPEAVPVPSSRAVRTVSSSGYH